MIESVSIERIETVASIQVALILRVHRVDDITRDDLKQEGRIKAWNCALKWRPDRGASYETFASRPVKLHLLDFLFAGGRPLCELEETIDPKSTGVDTEIDEAKKRKLVLGQIRILTPDEADFIVSHYYKDQTLGSWAIQRGRSKAWASKIHTTALGKLKQQRILCSI